LQETVSPLARVKVSVQFDMVCTFRVRFGGVLQT